MRHLVTLEVLGRRATLATANEAAWRQAVGSAVEAAVSGPWPQKRFSVRLEFRLLRPINAHAEWAPPRPR